MDEDLLPTEKKGQVLWITFNRPERRNALSPLLLFQLAELLKKVKQEDEVRCVVLRGAGDKAFSSGYDIAAIPAGVSPEVLEELRKKNPMDTSLDAIATFPYPVIAMINGVAFGAGCEVAATCDIRIAGESARLGMPPAKLGLVYMPAGLQRFVNVVGLAQAKEIFFTGRYYPVARAKEMGLVNYVVPDAQLATFTEEMAQEIAGNAPLSLRGMKTIFNSLLRYQKISPEDLNTAQMLVAQTLGSEDLMEGRKAFQEKRKPVFQGK
jgi:enoyl-CoA hydratase/carnithine racemase